MKFLKSLYFTQLFFLLSLAVIFTFILSFIFAPLFPLGIIFLVSLGLLAFTDSLILFFSKGMTGSRILPEKLSNGDQNQISINLENRFPFRIKVQVLDELPFQFQNRDTVFNLELPPRSHQKIIYNLKPVKRGVYEFGVLNVFVRSPMSLISRRLRLGQGQQVPVYPSFIQMRSYELMAINQDLYQFGLKRIRKIGQQQEFDHIKEYVTGEDYRTVNWKATARKAKLMVNQYQDEKSQPVYSLIDKSRVMYMPFEGMSLLDYSINASLAISKISIQKDDRPGLITFQDKIETLIPASNRNIQMHLIMEALYHQKTDFKESDFSRLYATLKNKITHRSLLLLFTNFESFSAMERQLPFLKKIAFNHLLVVIFFENTELQKLSHPKTKHARDVYHQVIGMKFAYQKKLIVRYLNQLGIQTILTSPESVTVDTINKYLEFKARGMI